MRHPHPRQDQKARVRGQQSQMAAARRGAPADEAIADPERARGRSPREARHRAIAGDDEVFQVLADRLLIAQIVILREQAVEERLVGRPADLMEDQRAERAERLVDRRRVDEHRRRAPARSPRLTRRPLRWRELNVAGAMQPQEQAATDRIAGCAIGLAPLPHVAELQRQGAATDPRRRPAARE